MSDGSGQGNPFGEVAGGILDSSFVQGLLNNADLNQLAEQLNMADPSNQAYAAWCKEFAQQKLDGTESIWNAPNDVVTFRERVTSQPGYGVQWFWADVIGRIDRNGRIKADPNTDNGAGGKGKSKDLDGGFVMVWPWEPGAMQAAAWYHWAIWLGCLALICVILLVWIPRLFKRRKYRRPKWLRRKQKGSIR